MYLFRAPNCTYYTRICLPKYLKVRGFRFDVKVSLLTKNRTLAISRNFDVASRLRQLIDSVTETVQADEFTDLVNQTVDEIRATFDCAVNEVQTTPNRVQSAVKAARSAPALPSMTLVSAQAQFIASKSKESISSASVKQLLQRTTHFIQSTEVSSVCDVSSAHALVYRDLLLTEGRSHKSNKDYLAAVSQFFKWCRLMQLTQVNPFDDIKLSQQNAAGPDSSRQRWQKTELKQLFSSQQFKSQDRHLKWVTLLMLYHGLRPSEACQLSVADIVEHEGVQCIRVCAEGESQRVKTSSSVRWVPIHGKLISLGFLSFVRSSKEAGDTQLFRFRPNTEGNWSRQFCKEFARMQNEMGMKARKRPTTYSFRHTFIDELKQSEVDENIVAELVGHKNQKITYGRYGKKYKVSLLQKHLDTVFEGTEFFGLFEI